jgi:hypothetical protein
LKLLLDEMYPHVVAELDRLLGEHPDDTPTSLRHWL